MITRAFLVTCPQCRRAVKAWLNRFGDWCYTRHKMAQCWDANGQVSAETKADLEEPCNHGYAYTYELDCPMSGQYVEPHP